MFQDGMAYVMLGRCERLQDLHIAGEFNIDKIRCSPSALKESQRVAKLYESTIEERLELKTSLRISYLNTRSLRAHLDDIIHCSELMSSTMLGIGETWLEPGSSVELPSFHGTFLNIGRGKGLATFCKSPNNIQIQHEDGACAMLGNICDIKVIFLYLSQGVDWSNVIAILDLWIQDSSPTVIMGDMNWHWTEDANHPMKNCLESKGLMQLVRGSTHDHGNCIDHIYVSQEVIALNPIVQTLANYYSDHDTISLVFPAIKPMLLA